MTVTIMTIDQHEMDNSVNISQRENYFKRTAVRAVLSDANGRIALMHVSKKGYYKLPGGGVDDGESLEEALARELLEEAGAQATATQELGKIIEWRDGDTMMQTSYGYSTLLIGEASKPLLTESERDQGFEVYWAQDINTAIQLVDAFAHHSDIWTRFMATRDAAILRAAQKCL